MEGEGAAARRLGREAVVESDQRIGEIRGHCHHPHAEAVQGIRGVVIARAHPLIVTDLGLMATGPRGPTDAREDLRLYLRVRCRRMVVA
jgi:hypothetical protein